MTMTAAEQRRVNQLVREVKLVQSKVLVAGRMKTGAPKDNLLASYNRQIRRHADKILDLGGDMQLLSMKQGFRRQKK